MSFFCCMDPCGHKLNENPSSQENFSHFSTRALCTLIFTAIIITHLVALGTMVDDLSSSPFLITYMVCASLVGLSACIKTVADSVLTFTTWKAI